jgi:hypothetical protein
MDTSTILTELRRQRDQLGEAIIAFERLAAGSGPRRGRPPKWLAAAREPNAVDTDQVPAPKRRAKKRKAGKKS